MRPNYDNSLYCAIPPEPLINEEPLSPDEIMDEIIDDKLIEEQSEFENLLSYDVLEQEELRELIKWEESRN